MSIRARSLLWKSAQRNTMAAAPCIMPLLAFFFSGKSLSDMRSWMQVSDRRCSRFHPDMESHCRFHLDPVSRGVSSRLTAFRPIAKISSRNNRVLVAQAAHSQLSGKGDNSRRTKAKALLLLGSILSPCGIASAAVHGEPANALSVPTWIIHISSVIEWTAAMFLMWRYAEVTEYAVLFSHEFAQDILSLRWLSRGSIPLHTRGMKFSHQGYTLFLLGGVDSLNCGDERWKGMTWGMIPLFAGALTACTYHFFYNASELDFLVAIQAALTWVGNATLWIAAYRIYEGSKTAEIDQKVEN